jgi:hypothetical protein
MLTEGTDFDSSARGNAEKEKFVKSGGPPPLQRQPGSE